MSSNADREFFEREIAGLLAGLYGAARRFAKNRADAEDIVAETVAKAWANLGTLQDRRCFRAWIFRILANTFFTECRRRAAAIDAGGQETEETADETGFSLFERLQQPFLLWWSQPEQEFLNKVLREQLERAVDALPEAFRMVLVLAEIEGFSYQEIAAMLDVPVGTVRSRLARARHQLQRALWEQAQAAGFAKSGAAPKQEGNDAGVKPQSEAL